MASTILSSVASLANKFLSLIPGSSSSSESLSSSITNEVRKLKSTIERVQAVIYDAENREIRDQSVKRWLFDLKQAAYDAEDILGTIDFRILESKLAEEDQSGKRKRKCFEVTGFSIFLFQDDSFLSDTLCEIKKINARFDEISIARTTLCLREEDGIRIVQTIARSTSSLINTSEIFGRTDEKNEIVSELVNDKFTQNFQIISIVAMGGMGKTTLAKLVYNDERVQRHFQLRSWVWVSETFEETRLTRAIIESMTSQSCSLTELDSLQRKLSDVISGKRFLIVLDDVWNIDPFRWEILRAPFENGNRGSHIIVTTRDHNSPYLMGAKVTNHELTGLAQCDSWELFCHQVVQGRSFSRLPQNLKNIGEKIVDKCGGVPLMVKVIGGLLAAEMDENSWTEILTTGLWDLDEVGERVIHILRLSYYHLPGPIRQCFIYCALFPKGHEFEMETLVRMWVAQGYIRDRGTKKMEEIGYEYVSDLVGRSFFHNPRYVGYKCFLTMHDLIHALAMSISMDPLFISECEIPHVITRSGYEITRSKYNRHFSALIRVKMRQNTLTLVPNQKPEGLRSLVLCLYDSNSEHFQLRTLSNLVVLHFRVDIFQRQQLQYLRVLELGRCKIPELPETICNLKQMRFLGLSFTDIVRLPHTLCTLYNLQTLDLRCCYNLVELPKDLPNMVNLRHLDYNKSANSSEIPSCNFQELPKGIGRLSKLQTLPTFVLSINGTAARIGELKDMNDLSGPLRLACLEQIYQEYKLEAREAKLSKKKNITWISFQWTSFVRYFASPSIDRLHTSDEELLENLQPHTNIERIEIEKYNGTRFPRWIGDPSFKKIVRVIFVHIRFCKTLPTLGQLISLKHLELHQMRDVKTIGAEFFGDGQVNFPSLQMLWFDEMLSWEKWWCNKEEYTFPKLKELKITFCANIKSISLHNLPVLKNLKIKGCGNLTKIEGLEVCWMSMKEEIEPCSSDKGELPQKLEIVEVYECMSLDKSSKDQAAEISRMFRLRSSGEEEGQAEDLEGTELLI